MVFREIAQRGEFHIRIAAAAPLAVLRQTLIGDQLRENRDRDLLRRDRADGQTDRRADLRHPLGGIALVRKHLHQPLDPAARADQTEIGRTHPGQQHAQTVRVVSVAACDNDHIIIGREVHAADGVFKAVTDDLLCQREACAVGKIGPVVRHNNGKAALCRKFHHVQRNMAAAEDKQPLLRQHRLTDGEHVAVPLRRYRGDHAALEILRGGDGGEAAGKALRDRSALAADRGFKGHGLSGLEFFQNILINVHLKHLRGGSVLTNPILIISLVAPLCKKFFSGRVENSFGRGQGERPAVLSPVR